MSSRKNILAFFVVILILVTSRVQLMAFTPTRYNFHYTTTDGRHGTNPVSNSWNHYSGYANHAVAMVSQDVVKARAFIERKVKVAKEIKERTAKKYRLIKNYGIPEMERQYGRFIKQSKREFQQIRDDYYEEKPGFISQMRQRTKANYNDFKDRVRRKIRKRVPSVRQVIWHLENTVDKILRRGFNRR